MTRSTIETTPETRDRLKKAARKDEKYDDFLNRLLDEHDEKTTTEKKTP